MRLIDAGKLIVEGYSLERNYRKDSSTMVLERCKIEDVPVVDAVEVVRCKNCIHAEEIKGVAENILNCKRLKMVITPEWYCAEGKRNG